MTGNGVRGLGIPSPLLWCHSSCCRGKSGSGECGLLPGAVRGGRHGVVGFFRLLRGERGVWECRLLSGLPSYSVASGAGAHRALVMGVSVIIQLMFLQYFENVEVPQIPSSTECYRFQLYSEACTYSANSAKAGDSIAQFLVRLFTRRCYAMTGAWGLTVPKNCRGSAVAIGAVLGGC